jgi:indolepyruvate ferredoxin oxidoreductase beta subunit
VKTTSLRGFLLLYFVASLRPWRRRSLRFAVEQQSIESWLSLVELAAAENYELSIEVARMRGLIKGYGDTHARGREKFDLLAAQLPALMQTRDGATRLAELHKAALADENGDALRACIDGQVASS